MDKNYRYDFSGRLTAVTDMGQSNSDGLHFAAAEASGRILAEYVYSASGNPVVKKIGGNITNTYAYDERNRLTEIPYPSALGGYTEKLGYDAAGNRIRRETEQEITTYRYDNCNRLQELRREYKNTETSTAQPQIIRYTYDRQGNMLSEGEKKYSYDSFGRMVRAEIPVEYRGASNKPDEHAGFSNAAQSAGETFGAQEISSVTREFQVQINRYDGKGLRHEMEENGRLIKFLYNEDREVVAEETGNGTITRYIRGLGIISSDSEEAKTYYHYVSDEQGSITHVLSEDAEILNHYSYDAFGNIIEKTEQVENRFCYNGEMLDPITQQYYLRARFYHPVIGRFTQEDTYYGDGLNLYQYCQANPVGYVDPSGHNICPTQLSLYKKYKEFFAKKMPEAEAKKKAYEYMRKKMGLTADNPFTEASEGGGTSSSKVWDYSKQFDGELANFNAGYEIKDVIDEDIYLVQFHSNAKVGSGRSLKYWTTFDEANGISIVDDYMNKMALLSNWGARDNVSIAKIPAGTKIKYAIGTAKEQAGATESRPGGGRQILFEQFDDAWVLDTRSLP